MIVFSHIRLETKLNRQRQMQAAGSPPADLVGDMNAAQDALGDMEGGCAQQ